MWITCEDEKWMFNDEFGYQRREDVESQFGPLRQKPVSQPTKTYDRPSWDEWALCIAEVVASRADCTRSQVGAVILSHTHRVLSVGYNGVIAGVPGCMTAGNCPRGQLSYEQVKADSDYSNCVATHAERNAIEHADPSQLKYSTLYVTRKPCPACTTLIKACGISRVVTPEDREEE